MDDVVIDDRDDETIIAEMVEKLGVTRDRARLMLELGRNAKPDDRIVVEPKPS